MYINLVVNVHSISYIFGNEDDLVEIELHQLDKPTFDYYRTLTDVIDGNSVAPSNPITNLSNGALGYFGAFSVDSATIIIE